MRTVAPIGAAAALLALGIAGRPDVDARTASSAASPARTRTVLAVRAQRGGVDLVRLDRRTLRALRGKVRLGTQLGAWSRSPDGSRFAIGVESALGLRLVDVRRMHRLGDVRTRNGQIAAVAWLAPRRIVGVEQTGVFAVDPVARRLIRAEPLDGWPVGVGRSARAMVVLLSPEGEIGPARVAVIGSEANVRLATLERIRAGQSFPQGPTESPAVGELHWPGLAVDRAGERAFVVGGGAPVAEVDLRTLAVSYHELSRPISLLRRFRNWLEPSAAAKGPVTGSTRRILWLPPGLLAVTGEDGRPVGPGRVETTRAGLTLVDTSSWTARTLHPSAGSAVFTAGTLVAADEPLERGSRGIGLVGFGLDGDRRLHLFGDDPVEIFETLDERVFVHRAGTIETVDVRRGRIVRTPPEIPQLLVGDMHRW